LRQEAAGLLERSDGLVNEVEVELLGKRYTFRSSRDKREVERVAGLVNKLAGDLRGAFPSTSSSRISVLAMMQLGYELLQLQDEYRSLKERFEQEGKRLLGLIE